ncbi:MAG: extracellular solute-binding protein [Alphaproteobacteria bacterium]|nr:extracellular solute-binding protein [Alphaproteobacteria bacterium]
MIRRRQLLSGAAIAALACATGPALAQQKINLNVVTAGDQNMVDYIKDYLGPMFEKSNPNVTVRAVGTGPGDAGSQKITEKLSAQKANAAWDVDVAVVHQKMAGDMVREGLLAPYVKDVSTGKMSTSATAKNALGQNVEGFVIPMFQSQTAIAYNPALVSAPPKTFADLDAWAKANPKKFGYNGIKGGMSGVAFVVGWVYANSPTGEKLFTGPYDEASTAAWDPAFAKLKEFNKNVTVTPGNAGTLDMLNRGEISMGPVWVDMFYTWMADGKLPPTMKLALIGPGLPGQPMYYVVPAKAANIEAAKKFVELATSPQVQAEGIVKKFNWYPGIDAQHVKSQLDEKTWNKLFVDVTPQDLQTKAKPFPVKEYFDAILQGYEKKVLN